MKSILQQLKKSNNYYLLLKIHHGTRTTEEIQFVPTHFPANFTGCTLANEQTKILKKFTDI